VGVSDERGTPVYKTRVAKLDRDRVRVVQLLYREGLSVISIAACRRPWPGVPLWDGLSMSVRDPGYISRANGVIEYE